jgi:hypothetical protein
MLLGLLDYRWICSGALNFRHIVRKLFGCRSSLLLLLCDNYLLLNVLWGSTVKRIEHLSKFIGRNLFQHLFLFLHKYFVIIQSSLMGLDKLCVIITAT